MIFQDDLQDELSSYADEVFETPSEAAVNQLDERELTGSPLDKSELERSHLMLWVLISTTPPLNSLVPRSHLQRVFPPLQPPGARLEEGQRRLLGSTQGALKTGSGKRQPAATRPEDRGSGQEAVCQGEEAVRARHGGPAHQPYVPQAHRQLRQKADRGHGRSQVTAAGWRWF